MHILKFHQGGHKSYLWQERSLHDTILHSAGRSASMPHTRKMAAVSITRTPTMTSSHLGRGRYPGWGEAWMDCWRLWEGHSKLTRLIIPQYFPNLLHLHVCVLPITTLRDGQLALSVSPETHKAEKSLNSNNNNKKTFSRHKHSYEYHE